MPNTTWVEPASNDDYPVIPQSPGVTDTVYLTNGESPYIDTTTWAAPVYAGYIEIEENVAIQLRTRPTWYSRLAMRLLGWRWVDTETTNGNATG